MPISWNEIKNKALAFSKRWEDATREDADAKPFWIDFFEIFGISNSSSCPSFSWWLTDFANFRLVRLVGGKSIGAD